MKVLKIHAMPVQHKLAIDISSSQDTSVKCVISDFYGKSIYEEQMQINKGDQTININLPSFSGGKYLIKFIEKDGGVVQKFIKS